MSLLNCFLQKMTDFHSETETDFSDDETIYSDSDISSDESVHTSDEDFIDNSDVSEDEAIMNIFLIKGRRCIHVN